MLSQDTKDSISVLTAVASAVSALAALGIAIWVFFGQRRLQRQQLRQDLFDKRFAVYAAVETFMMSVIQANMLVGLTEHRTFLYAIEPAEFLFGSDVGAYLQEIRNLIIVLSEKQQKVTTQNSYGEHVVAPSDERTALLRTLGSIYERRNQVFRPHLRIHEE